MHQGSHSKMMAEPGLEPKARLVPPVPCIFPKSEASQKEDATQSCKLLGSGQHGKALSAGLSPTLEVTVWGSSTGATTFSLDWDRSVRLATHQRDSDTWMGRAGTLGGSPDRPHLLGDEGAGERDRRPEEDAAAEDHFPVEAVTQVAKDGGSHHEAADEHCAGRGELRGGTGPCG